MSLARFSLVLLIASISTPAVFGQDDGVDFNRDIRPILSNKCFACHGPDEETVEAGLRLDSFESATEDLGGYQAVVPGKPDESELIVRVTSDDEDEIMPPLEHGKPLNATEKKLLRDWIRAGGKFSKHWSYEKPVRPKIPHIESEKFKAWQKNEIDHFAFKRMIKQQLSPAKPANRYAIIRRLALDLTGLPPTLQEADEFVNDKSPDAYEKLVDRLMAKKAFGERWATPWLDLARYADSAGYAEDRKRTIWAFRDYVIRSLNTNKRFDQFTIEQIAGDLLPQPTTEQLVATAFHRNTLTNSEGGTSDEEFRNAAVVDRVNTTMAVWMGTTMACAQCHTHKYDPITQKEYFQFFDFFNSTADNDRPNETPVFNVYTEKDQNRREFVNERIHQWKDRLAAAKKEHFAQPLKNVLQRVEKLASDGKIQGRFVRVEIINRVGILSLAEVQVFSGGKNIARQGKATQSTVDYAGPANLAIDGNTDGDFNKKSVTHTKEEGTPWWQVDLGSSQEIDQILIWNRTDGNVYNRLNGCRVSILDDFQKPIWHRDFPTAQRSERKIDVVMPPKNIRDIIKLKIDKIDSDQEKTIREFDWNQSQLSQRIQLVLDKYSEEFASIRHYTTVPVMRELGKKRTTNIQVRGNYLDTSETVSSATPKVFHALPANQPLNRLTLAKWLVDKNNPLTARVVANRYWELLFGLGLVPTSEEFGIQGEMPSHPQLLDWLATELMDSGWDQKALIKKIVMSATYRQSSVAEPEKIQRDAANRWLARGPRVRLTAEMIRDQALAASGLLSTKMYGPPVQPPQPKFGLKAAFSGSVDWKDSTGPNRYRRAIYTEWRRSAPYPSMATFDKSNLEVCEIRRASTNTPLQALVTLNDPVYVEAAQALARRVSDKNDDPAKIAELAFRLVLIRKPKSSEVDRILQLYHETKKHFTDKPADAKKLATDPHHPLAKNVDVVELAAWTTVANVLLNLDEAFLKP